MKRTLIGTIILSALVCAFTSCSSCSGRRTAEDQLADSTKAALEMEKRMNAEPEGLLNSLNILFPMKSLPPYMKKNIINSDYYILLLRMYSKKCVKENNYE